MDTLGALALATEPPHDGLMQRPPVQRNQSFITRTMWRNIFGQSTYQLAILLVLNFAGKQILGLSGSDATDVLNTFIFNTFVFCQVRRSSITLHCQTISSEFTLVSKVQCISLMFFYFFHTSRYSTKSTAETLIRSTSSVGLLETGYS